MTLELAQTTPRFTFAYFANGIVGALLILGLILSVLSTWEICTTACAEGHLYRIYGFHFETLGITFFAVSIAFFFLSVHWPWLMTLVKWMVAGSFGAELYFIYLQKYIIGHWCPLCLTIAATVALIALVFSIQYALSFKGIPNDPEKRIIIMKKTLNGMTGFAIGILGFAFALFGIAKPEHSFADPNSRGESPVFGNPRSTVEVYFFTDWFCPACRKTEPELAKKYPAIMAKARLFFIDVPIHEDSLNFLPYNLSFMLKHKDQYFQLRRDLEELAQSDHSPSEHDIEALAAKHGVTYEQLDFAEVNQAQKYFKKMADKYSIDSTPPLVVTHPATKKAKKFSGYKEITQANIPHIIDQLK